MQRLYSAIGANQKLLNLLPVFGLIWLIQKHSECCLLELSFSQMIVGLNEIFSDSQFIRPQALIRSA